jgi:7-carboxy-7-deazaguanine synthase
MKISEIFYSIQGEGIMVGVPSVFVRVSGCNLRCTWCDTPYASWDAATEPSRDLAPLKIAMEVEGYMSADKSVRHVVITGGEPMIMKEMPELLQHLHQLGHHITVETAGTVWIDGLGQGWIDLASISPKLSNSTPHEREGGRLAQAHDRNRIDIGVLKKFATRGGGVIKKCQWKFVISREGDLVEMEELLTQLNTDLSEATRISTEDVLLMPEGTDATTVAERSRWLAEVCKTKGYRLSPRLHVNLWGNTRGT